MRYLDLKSIMNSIFGDKKKTTLSDSLLLNKKDTQMCAFSLDLFFYIIHYLL